MMGLFDANRVTAMLFMMPFSLLPLLSLPPATAQESRATCARIASRDTPTASSEAPDRSETWCWRILDQPAGSILIYNADEANVPLELTALVDKDGTVTHASMLAGNLTIHKVVNFNPLPVPLRPPSKDSFVPVADASPTEQSIEAALETLRQSTAPPKEIKIEDDAQFASEQSPISPPWRGYWWPYHKKQMHEGSESPLAKYDRFVQRRTGKIPGAQAWESQAHIYLGEKWAGHCNGWAAASILRREPTRPLQDAESGVIFSISDLKALLIEKDYCVKYSMFGRRYSGHSTDDIKDISPVEFHKVVVYHLAELHKPLILDEDRGKTIENQVVSGFTMKIRREKNNVFKVKATLTIHKYDSALSQKIGVAPSIQRSYEYRLVVDENGRPVSGRWISKNPDFIWVPLKTAQCSPSNPRVTEPWLKQILALRPVSEPASPPTVAR